MFSVHFGGLLGDLSNQVALDQVVFTRNRRISESSNWYRHIFVDFVGQREALISRLEEGGVWGHVDAG